MNILVTGAAGFIGMHTCKKLLKNHKVIGIDNFDKYYSVYLKKKRIEQLVKNRNFYFAKIDIRNNLKLNKIFKKFKPKIVIHLAAQAGVRYSLKNPEKYIQSNILGFFNILENCKNNNSKKLIYASTSSVYGNIKKFPFKENMSTSAPLSVYAVTKKTNELLAYSYHHLYNLKTIGLRFFTVYGPWGRPDMALFSFVKSIIKKNIITIYGRGKLRRDFTYIDDVVNQIEKITKLDVKFYNNQILNIGGGKPVKLMNFIKIIEKYLLIKAKIKFIRTPKTDVKFTYADSSKLRKLTKINFKTDIDKGVFAFVNWYKNFYKV
jgi:UDP-glucuronate 4-epimerase